MQTIPWILTMAWRDSRRNRARLLLFVSSIILGIAALVSIYSLSDNMRLEIDRQAAELLGADLEVSSNHLLEGKLRDEVARGAVDSAEERRFTSMIYFPASGNSRLGQVRALKGGFPYYGELETVPASAARGFQKSRAALVDQTLMIQYNVKPGDSVKVGNTSFVVMGSLVSAPGQTGLSSSVAPIVYIPMQYLEATGLSQKGSRINYSMYFQFPKTVKVDERMKALDPQLSREGFRYDTVESQKENTNRSLKDLTQFLSLVGFIALLLGCIGVASSIHIYVREKIASVAVLRCLGASGRQAFLIYLVQIVVIGFIGSLIGALLGTVLQQFLPVVLKDFLPVTITTGLSWSSILLGIFLGVAISFLFALLPLISIRKVSPLNTLRISLQPVRLFRDPLKWAVYLLITLFIFGFSYTQLGSWDKAFFFILGVLAAFLVLAGIAALLMWAVRTWFPQNGSYVARQGLANLFRPNNQTTILVVVIGLGTALIGTLISLQTLLLNRVSLSAANNQPNTVLFDIQPAQRQGVVELARSQGLPVNGTVPIVNMRLESVNDITAERQLKDSTLPIQSWVFSREYRVTFRDSLISSEKLAKGTWHGTVDSANPVIYVSLEERFASRNGIKIGDTMVFNVQGSILQTIVGSWRSVDWNRIQTNFLVVFPKGVLEEAPQFHVLLTRVPDKEVSARFQRAVVQQYPNVSIIDLGLVLRVLDQLLEKVGLVIRFMAAFSILTGLVVLIASVRISKYQRMQESVLLRTLGASRKQIVYITALEYIFLGSLAALTGLLLSLVATALLARFTFDAPFQAPWMALFLVFISISVLTLVIGILNSRSVVNRPPLEILREEV